MICRISEYRVRKGKNIVGSDENTGVPAKGGKETLKALELICKGCCTKKGMGSLLGLPTNEVMGDSARTKQQRHPYILRHRNQYPINTYRPIQILSQTALEMAHYVVHSKTLIADADSHISIYCES